VAVDMPDLAARLPVPWFFEAETAPYITAGAVIARDPRGGAANLSIARLKLLGGNRALIGVAPNHHVAMFAREARSRGEPLPIAVCVGVPPAVLVAACLYLGRGDDEMAYAGALLGEGVATLTTPDGLAVPATSEVVLEGHLDPAEQVAEGPVSEFHGMYEDYGTGPVVTVRRLTRRSDAIFQVVEPGYHAEHALLGAVAIEAGLARGLRSRLPVVRAVRITHAGAGRLAAVVALGPHRTGAAQQVAFGIWSAVSLVKLVTVVDDDVDIDEPAAVAHAVATRVRAERDVLVVPGGPGDRAEPLERDGSVARLAIDATRAPTDRDWRVAAPPADVVRRVRERLATVEIGGI
jgi:4-hydroxy-3-polyprenylbenzoate decarboxylase